VCAVVSDQSTISVRAFLRDLRWMVPLVMGVILLLWLLDVGGMGDLTLIEALYSPSDSSLCGSTDVGGMGRAMFTRHARDPALWRFLGGSVVWAVVSFAASP
jgi:hypothetical protein